MSTDRRGEHLVSAQALRAELGTGLDQHTRGLRRLRLLDVRWRLTDGPGEGALRYAGGHLPGARFLDLETVLTRHTGEPRDGRHPLPDRQTLADGLGAAGVEERDDIVVYDEPGSFAAERAWWVLRWAGLRARVLDGGLAAWVAAGGDLETGHATPLPAPAPLLTTGALSTVDADQAAALPARGTLLDARAPERYRGEVETLDPRPGHIPGARNAPAAALYTEDGRMPSDDDLRALLGPGVAGGPVGVYCGSGVSASRGVLALALVGVDAALFPGSWSAWSNDSDRRVVTGPDPGSPG